MPNRAVLPKPALVLGGSGTRGLSRWHWAADESQRNRLVKVAVLRIRDDDGNELDLVARVFGAEKSRYVLLEERGDVSAAVWDTRRSITAEDGRRVDGEILFGDGTKWALHGGGCGCGHPLKKFDPLRSKVAEG